MVPCWIETVDQIFEEGCNGAVSLHLKLKRTPDFWALARAVRSLASLQEITITDYTGSEELWNNGSLGYVGFFEALGSLPNLKRIRLEHFGNPYLRQSVPDLFPIQYFATLLNQPNCNIHSLDIEHLSAFGDPHSIAEFNQAIQNHSSLRNFRMFLCRMVGTGDHNDHNSDRDLTTGFINQLTVGLSGIGRIETVAIFLEHTNIYLTPASIERLLTSTPHLRELVLKGISLNDDCLAALARALRTSQFLEVLELNLYERIKSGGLSLARSIQNNRSLKRLGIMLLHQSRHFLLEIADALCRNNTLNELYLTGSTQYVEQGFLSMLENNCALETLHIQHCQQIYWAQIAFYLNLNRHGRQVSKFVTLSRNEWIDLFVEADNGADLSYLYYFMRMNPSIVNSAVMDDDVDIQQQHYLPCKRIRRTLVL